MLFLEGHVVQDFILVVCLTFVFYILIVFYPGCLFYLSIPSDLGKAQFFRRSYCL